LPLNFEKAFALTTLEALVVLLVLVELEVEALVVLLVLAELELDALLVEPELDVLLALGARSRIHRCRHRPRCPPPRRRRLRS
jgi:hypothetical protein